MKLKMITLFTVISLLLMATSCATTEWLLEDSSTPTTAVKPAPQPIEEQPVPAPAPKPVPAPAPKPVPAPAPKPVVELKPAPAPAPQKTYQIGTKGPAGGFIVYDKGSITDGWRYLEIAPVETEFAYIEWGGYGTAVEKLQKGIGTGLENTQRIVSVFGSKEPNRGNNYPAKMCDDLVYNGYSDWFLPSLEELRLLYTNLIANDMGDFSDSPYYWSSTEEALAFAWNLNGVTGEMSNVNRDFKNKTRAMRRF